MNIPELLLEHNIPTAPEGHHHSRPGWIQIDCPWCSPDSQHFRLGVNIEYGYCNCWHCGHHSLVTVLATLLRISFQQIRDLTKDLKGLKVERPAHAGQYTEPYGVMGLLGPHKIYLKRRGFSPSKIERLWSVHSIGIAPSLSWRLFIPIIHHGILTSWTTRSIGKDDKAKYISAQPEQESIPHKHLLYGEDYCRHAIVVCEGPIDAWAIGPGAVATFGLSLTNEQVVRIAKYPKRAICFDNEPNAQKVARKLVNDLSGFPGETMNIVLDSKDPGEASPTEIKRIRKEVLE